MRKLLLLITLLAPFPVPASQDDDERWIDRYVETVVQQERRAELAVGSVPFEELAGMRGQDVLVVLSNGQQRRGVILRASPSRLNLRVALPSGYADYEVARRDVRRISKEATP